MFICKIVDFIHKFSFFVTIFAPSTNENLLRKMNCICVYCEFFFGFLLGGIGGHVGSEKVPGL